jgi:hypothetical protein
MMEIGYRAHGIWKAGIVRRRVKPLSGVFFTFLDREKEIAAV